MRRINFHAMRFTTLLAITNLSLSPAGAIASPWKVKTQDTQGNHTYSLDPKDKIISSPGIVKGEELKAYETNPEIDWDNLDRSNFDRVFDSSNLPTNGEKPIKPKSPLEKSATASRKASSEHFRSLITENEPAVNEIRTFVSKGKIARLNNESLLAQIQEANKNPQKEEQTILINFNNVSIIEYIRFISRVSNKNFIFNEEDLQFTVTIVSEEPTTLENVLMALFQELRVRNLSVLEEGNTIIIHRTDSLRAPGTVVSDTYPLLSKNDADIITRVFRLNIADAEAVAGMIRPILSEKSIIQVLSDTNHLVITDISSNIEKAMQLIKSVDAPNSSMVVGQYVVRNAYIDDLISNGEQIMNSIARGQPITFVAHPPSNSIFIIAAPFLVERAIPVLQRLDQNDGTTGIFDLNQLKYITPSGQKEFEEALRRREGGIRVTPDASTRILPDGTQVYQAPAAHGFWKLDANGNWIYEPTEEAVPGIPIDSTKPPPGYWKQDYQNHWEFVQGTAPPGYRSQQLIQGADGSWQPFFENGQGPEGRWEFGSDSKWRFLLRPGASIFAGKRIRASLVEPSLPLGDIERTRFYIHKLQYRKGDSIQNALQQIGASLSATQSVNLDLIQAIESTQWLEPSNSLIITGTPAAILKVKELIDEIDRPLRQVFIEILVLDLSIDDALQLGVTWGSRFGGGNTAGAQAFIAGASPIDALLASASGANTVPNARPALGFPGYAFGIVGQRISAGGTEFASLSAFVHALHEKSNINVVLNPKILTEDNLTAELFVGENTPFKTQSIANDQGQTITSNFEFKDVGATLRVTPFLGNSNIITMEIEFEQSSVVPGTGQGGGDLSNTPIGPTTRINRTKTRIHMPDGFFLVLSGMISSTETRERRHVPCLGGVPIIGAAFTDKNYRDEKRNLMLFVRPQIIDTEIQMDNLTEHQQNIFKIKSRTKRMWKLDYEETLDWLNVIQTDPNNNENECCQENDIFPQRHKRLCR